VQSTQGDEGAVALDVFFGGAFRRAINLAAIFFRVEAANSLLS
jgi:hypothetical protein